MSFLPKGATGGNARRRSCKPLLMALLLTPVAVLAATAPASASASAVCYGPSCVHRDPTSGCVDGNSKELQTVLAPGGIASVTLRYSPTCTANWARLNADTPGWDFYVQTYYDGHIEYRTWSASYYTYMVDGRQPARACIRGYGSNSWACTRWQ